jgi:predicted phage terminase large subunit-like protein
VMTRWHEDDLAGRLLRAGSDEWTLLELPALAEADDPLGRDPGEALCPGLGFDERFLNQTRAELGSYWFAALYQQRPRPAAGMLFKRRDFRYWRPHPDEELYLLEGEDGGLAPIGIDCCIHFQTVDVAASERQSADYTVVSSWALTPNRQLLLLDRERQRFEALDVGGLVERAYRRQEPKPSFIGIEEFGYGLGVVQELNRKGLPIHRLRPDRDKVARALVAVARYEEHRVFHPRGASWLAEWEEELLAFPNGTHDDQVDTLAYAARELERVGFPRPRKPRQFQAITAGIRTKAL